MPGTGKGIGPGPGKDTGPHAIGRDSWNRGGQESVVWPDSNSSQGVEEEALTERSPLRDRNGHRGVGTGTGMGNDTMTPLSLRVT